MERRRQRYDDSLAGATRGRGDASLGAADGDRVGIRNQSNGGLLGYLFDGRYPGHGIAARICQMPARHGESPRFAHGELNRFLGKE